MTFQHLLEFFIKENELFDINKFFIQNTNKNDNGALILITPNQMIKTRTIDNGNGIGSGYHDETKYYLDHILYDNPSEELQNNQNIFLRMFNENIYLGPNIKSIFIHFPKKITHNQLKFLKLLEEEYQELFIKISNEQTNQYQSQEDKNNNKLIGFKTIQGDIVTCDSLKPVITYVKTNLLDDNIDIINEDIIIGTTLQSKHK